MKVIGKDTCGQDIIPIANKLVLKTNVHPTCDGYAWGWIEGCSKNICWSNENTRFTRIDAEILVREYNQSKQ